MPFSQNPTVLMILLNTLIIGLIAFIIWWTGNPLALLGLLCLQQVPVYVPEVEQPVQAEGEEAGEYDSTEMGFTAKI